MNAKIDGPEAVLFDFGGVLVDSTPRDEGYGEVADEIYQLLAKHRRNGLDVAQIESDIRTGIAAYEAWKYSQSRFAEPEEMSHRSFWEDCVAADWPVSARLTVAAHAVPLCNQLEGAIATRRPREGLYEVLRKLHQYGVPMGLISNSFGANWRRHLVREFGFDEFLGVQVYSDEIGIRKPHPYFFHWGCRSLGVEPDQTWYVGDTLDRDILGARRSGIGRAILIKSTFTDSGPDVKVKPDDEVNSAQELEVIFEAAYDSSVAPDE